ncbi:MAG: hypothetical protein ABI629_15835 [bacterium]
MVVSAGLASAIPQGDAQQKCLNNINKTAAKVTAKQDGVNTGCVKSFVKGKISGPAAAEGCINGDAKQKVQKAKTKVSDEDAKSCSAAPGFGYTGGVFAGTSAAQAGLDVIHDAFGTPVDNGLLLCDTYPLECKCQQIVPKRLDGMFRAMSKVWLGCKRSALAIGKDPFSAGAANAGELQRCLTDGTIALSVATDTKGKIGGASAKLGSTVGQFCGLGSQDEFAGGACAALTGLALNDCLSQNVKCRFCEAVNAVDGLSADCDAFAGTTCP